MQIKHYIKQPLLKSNNIYLFLLENNQKISKIHFKKNKIVTNGLMTTCTGGKSEEKNQEKANKISR